ncbi:MAG: InlB B-repeat-containing protein, partial [Ruminococcus sp.]
YEGLDSKYYKYIYDDYNPAGSSKIINLYDIFFSEEEGNLIPPEGIDYSKPVTFVSNDIYTEYTDYKSARGWYEYWSIYCKIYEAYGTISDKYTLIANYEDAYTQYHHYIDKEYVDGFIMVIPVATPNNEVNAGQGEIVTEKTIPFTVKFDANGGRVDIKSIKTDMNGYIAKLPTPSYAGYEFDGWYTAEGVKVTSDTQFTENTTVHAKWIRVNPSTNDTNPTKYSAPKTGDSRPIVLWFALFFVSGGVFIGANAYRKRENND